jgi:hypothetical protein
MCWRGFRMDRERRPAQGGRGRCRCRLSCRDGRRAASRRRVLVSVPIFSRLGGTPRLVHKLVLRHTHTLSLEFRSIARTCTRDDAPARPLSSATKPYAFVSGGAEQQQQPPPRSRCARSDLHRQHPRVSSDSSALRRRCLSTRLRQRVFLCAR